jgi:hypothetical protein
MATPRQGMAQNDPAYSVASRTAPASTSKGLAAIDGAARRNKYLFIYFWKENNEQSTKMYDVFQSAMRKWSESTDSIGINVTDPGEKPVVDKFGISRAPMPLVVALAPNGAITKGFPLEFDEAKLREGFVSPGTAKCLKALQARKLVLLCVQNQKTQFTQVAVNAVREFKADARFGTATEIVALDPEDQNEAKLLQGLKVDPGTSQAVTVVLAPPGRPVARFVGAVSKDEIVTKVQAGPCAGGKCGPGGCCGPKK